MMRSPLARDPVREDIVGSGRHSRLGPVGHRHPPQVPRPRFIEHDDVAAKAQALAFNVAEGIHGEEINVRAVGVPRDVRDACSLRHLARHPSTRRHHVNAAAREECDRGAVGRPSRARRRPRCVREPSQPGTVGVDPPEMRDAPIGGPVGRRQHERDCAAVGRDLRVADARDIEQIDQRHWALRRLCGDA